MFDEPLSPRSIDALIRSFDLPPFAEHRHHPTINLTGIALQQMRQMLLERGENAARAQDLSKLPPVAGAGNWPEITRQKAKSPVSAATQLAIDECRRAANILHNAQGAVTPAPDTMTNALVRALRALADQLASPKD